MRRCQHNANDPCGDPVSTGDTPVPITPPAPWRSVWHDAAGRLHRLVGPAVLQGDGHQEWWVHGRHVTAEVDAWIYEQGIALPFTAEQQAEFVLKWL